MPDSFLGLEKSCSDSDPYDNFILACTASKPPLVIPTLEVIWLHNGTERQGIVIYNSEGTYTINTLSFTKTFANDSGTYSCHVKLSIPDSSDISLIKNITVTLRCKCSFFRNYITFLLYMQPKEVHMQPLMCHQQLDRLTVLSTLLFHPLPIHLRYIISTILVWNYRIL